MVHLVNPFWAVLKLGACLCDQKLTQLQCWTPPFWLVQVPYYTLVTLWHILVNKLVSLTPQTNNTCRKLRVSALQQYKGWGVADRVFLSKYASAQKGWVCVFSGFWGDLELRPLFEKYKTCGDSYVRSTERKSLPVLKTPSTEQSQLNNASADNNEQIIAWMSWYNLRTYIRVEQVQSILRT